jgi:hypothetical protein
MMQAAKLWHRNNSVFLAGAVQCRATGWRSFRQPEMRSILVVVADVFVHQAFQMAFIDNDYMVEQIAATVADEALGDTVLPWTSEAGPLRFDAYRLGP